MTPSVRPSAAPEAEWERFPDPCGSVARDVHATHGDDEVQRALDDLRYELAKAKNESLDNTAELMDTIMGEMEDEAHDAGDDDEDDDPEVLAAIEATRPRNVPRTNHGTRNFSFRGGESLRLRHMRRATKMLGIAIDSR